MKTNKIILIILFSVLVYSCQSTKEALEGKRRSESSDEFLIEKKNPLTTPPDYNKLPVPIDQEQAQSVEENNLDLKQILEVNQNEEINNQSNTDSCETLEECVLDQIND